MCGVGLIALLTPLASLAQGTGGMGSTGGTGGISAPGSGLAQGVGNTGGTGGGGTGGTGGTTTTAQGVSAALGAGLTQKTALFSASAGSTGSATSIPSNANKFIGNYVMPTSLGLPSLYASQFGAENVITTSGGPKGKFTYLYVPAPTAATTTATTTTQANGFTTYGQLRNPVYQTGFSSQVPIVQHTITDLHTRVRDAINRSSQLQGKHNIQVSLDGDTLVLSGTVGSDHERRLAEGLARITPGVNGVPLRNDIGVVTLQK